MEFHLLPKTPREAMAPDLWRRFAGGAFSALTRLEIFDDRHWALSTCIETDAVSLISGWPFL
jgi:hypothetical protein